MSPSNFLFLEFIFFISLSIDDNLSFLVFSNSSIFLSFNSLYFFSILENHSLYLFSNSSFNLLYFSSTTLLLDSISMSHFLICFSSSIAFLSSVNASENSLFDKKLNNLSFLSAANTT